MGGFSNGFSFHRDYLLSIRIHFLKYKCHFKNIIFFLVILVSGVTIFLFVLGLQIFTLLTIISHSVLKHLA